MTAQTAEHAKIATPTSSTARLRPRRRPRRGSLTAKIVVALCGVFAFLPVLWMVVTSVTADADVFRFPVTIIRTLTLDHYREFFADGTLVRFMVNGLVVSLVTAAF